uniref:Alpha-amylase_C n=1 Tax=uncultured Methylobacterium sp. TaxID=157278 RepID=A0A060C581_9HYPH|nr:alpha-amylase_C [uncultured Methylobacterium sp.]
MQRDGYWLGAPAAGSWREVFNSDAARYGGGNQGNLGEVWTLPEECHGYPQRLSLCLPGLAALVFRYEGA